MKKLFLLGLLGLQQLTFIFSISYDFTCPPRSQWKKRALKKCHPKVYHCLFDVNSGKFTEVCQGYSFPLEKGLKIVLSKNLDTKKCPEHLYMPYIIKSDESHDCVFSKSSCNEEGQITCRVRSGEKDAVCACNFIDGYTFIQTPKHISYCVPSEEDCSCYKKNETLTQDYPCIPQDEICGLQQFFSIVISFQREKHKDSFAEASMIGLQKPEISESKVPYLDRNKDIIEDGIMVLIIVLVVAIFGNIFLERNGVIEFPEFLTVMSRKINEIDNDDEIRDAISIMFKDRESVSATEVWYLMRKFGDKLTDEETQDMINQARIDTDGKIKYDDCLRIMGVNPTKY